MRIGFQRLSLASAGLCLLLAIAWSCFPQLLLALFGVATNDQAAFVGRRNAALFAGLGVMLFRLRHAGPSPARDAVRTGFAAGCALLALLGIGEWAVGHAGPGILLAAALEAALAVAFLTAA